MRAWRFFKSSVKSNQHKIRKAQPLATKMQRWSQRCFSRLVVGPNFVLEDNSGNLCFDKPHVLIAWPCYNRIFQKTDKFPRFQTAKRELWMASPVVVMIPPLPSGWWFLYLPLWKMMDFVSWDKMKFPTESHKIPWFQSPPTSVCWFINHYNPHQLVRYIYHKP